MTTKFGLGRQLVRTNHSTARGQLVARGPARSTRWWSRHAALAVASDVVAIATPALSFALTGGGVVAGAGVVGIAALGLGAAGAWDPARVGRPGELGALLRGLLGTAAAIALISLALHTLAGGPWVFLVLPVAAVLAVAGRLGLRGLLQDEALGTPATRVLAVGSHESVITLVERTWRVPELGWVVVAACTPTGTGARGSATVRGVPVVGDLDAVPGLAGRARFDVVAVSPAPGWSARRLRDLAWHLEGSDTGLVVDPGLLECAGPRTHLTTVDGLGLLRLGHPALPSAARRLKAVVDRTVALLLLVVITPLLLLVTAALWRNGGPAFVRQERVRAGGRTFRMFAFRCTDVEGAVTPLGAFLRRHRLDCLPQLFNVAAGSMAIVGPQPPATGCVEGTHTPLVEPGLTGLRSVGPLAGIAGDLRERGYVENWTLALDARMLADAIWSALTASAQVRRGVSR